MNDDIAERLKKLTFMIEKGTENEKKNARRLYDLLEKKYGIDGAVCSKQKVFPHDFKFENDIERDLVRQIYNMVTDRNDVQRYVDRRRKNYIIFNCTDDDFEMIKLYFEIYNESLKKEMEYFILGFFVKNNIHGKLDSSDSGEDVLDWNEKRKILSFADGIDYVKKPYALIEG